MRTLVHVYMHVHMHVHVYVYKSLHFSEKKAILVG